MARSTAFETFSTRKPFSPFRIAVEGCLSEMTGISEPLGGFEKRRREFYGRMTTTPGLEGRLKFAPRSRFSSRVVGTSNSAIGTFLVHDPLFQ
jgi:hypothetical protein